MTYKREKRVRPVLVVKPLPASAKKFERYYVGVNDDNQYVFEFPNRHLPKDFLDEVGGALAGGTSAPNTVFLNIEIDEKKAKAQKDMINEVEAFSEMQRHLAYMYKQKLPYLNVLGAGKDPSIVHYFTLLWERDFWRDKYFKEHDKRG